MKLTTRGRFGAAVLSWIAALALLTIAPLATAQNSVIASAGADADYPDTDGVNGENIVLDASGSRDPDGYDITNYQWSRSLGHGQYQSIGTSNLPEYPIRLEDGSYNIQLRVIDASGESSTDDVYITIGAPAPLSADAGDDRTIDDSNDAAGERVRLDGSRSTGSIVNYQWARYDGEGWQLLGNSMSSFLDTSLPDGINTIRLTVTDTGNVVAEDTVVITVNAPRPPANRPPTANAGGDRTVDDSDRRAGETVALDGSGSSDPDGNGDISTYRWRRLLDSSNAVELGSSSSPTLSVSLPDGTNTIQLLVTDRGGITTQDTVQITVNSPPLTADAGDDRTVNDTDNAAGETVRLDGSRSIIPAGDTVHYYWTLRVGDGGSQELGNSNQPTLDARLPDGENIVELQITGSSENRSSDTVTITVRAPTSNGLPTANAGGNRTVNDTDRAPGENVTLDGSASTDPGGQITSYTWTRVTTDGVQTLGSEARIQAALPDGANTIRLTVTDNSENTASDTVVITVGAAPTSSAPTANAGADRTIEDTDHEQGEDVTLDGSWSSDPGGTITDFAWSRIDGETVTALGHGISPTLRTRLPDGDSVIQLVVTDNSGATASDTVLITVNAGQPAITHLGDLPGLTPNQKNVADALDRICAQLRDRSGGEGPQLTGDQQDLLARCDGLQMNNTTANQVAALDELVADDFAVARTQTLLFANTQYAGVMDRLMALRGGAKGLSLAGLNIILDGSPVPLAELQDMVKGLLGGGASADEPGGLLNDKWGLWARGNYSMGEKDRNTRSPGFDADQWAMVGGVDYRFSDKLVGGVSLAYGESSIDIDGGSGGLQTDSYAMSLYGSAYVAKQYYLDAIVNVANADYGADRNIAYVDGAGLVDLDARGDTSGMTYSAGISGGRDFLYRGFTVSPTLGFFYVDATIDGFTESGAGGLSLIYDEQTFQSLTGNLGFRVTYAYNTAMGVFIPHLRVDYVREFKTDVDVFGVRFAGDPNATSTPPILVATDNPDESYWRLATGLSAQFVHGISGYVEYQRLESFEFISFQDVSLGLRFQKSF